MDFQEYFLLLAVIAGVTELISRARAKDWWVVTTILCAVAVGILFGLSHYYPSLDAVEGAVAGFSAAGVLKGISMFGNKSTPAKSEAFVK